MTAPSARRRGGRPPRLSREAIVAAAADVVAVHGIEALTMRRVADELGASPMAIYRHVRDKDELLVALLDLLASRVERPRLPSDPRERVIAACQTMRDGLAEHAWIVDVLAQGDLIAPSILWVMEEIVAGFVRCGLTPAEAAAGYRAVWQFTVGELMITRGVQRMATLDRPPFVLQVLSQADPERLPTLAALAPHWSSARASDSYGPGLRALVDGLLGAAGDQLGLGSGRTRDERPPMPDETLQLHPASTALLVMDYQPGIVAMLEDPEPLLSGLERLIARVRERGGHVGYVRVAFTDDDVAAIPETSPMRAAASRAQELHADAPGTQIHERLAPRDGDIVVRKVRVGSFSTTDLDDQLRARGVDTLVLAGLSTSGVVLSTVRDGADRDYRMIVLSDASADPDPEIHEFLVARVLPRQATIATVADIERALAG